MPTTDELTAKLIANSYHDVGAYISWNNEGSWDNDEQSDWVERIRYNSMQGIQYITESGECINEDEVLTPPTRKHLKRKRLDYGN